MAEPGTELPLAERLEGLRLPPPVPESAWPLDTAATLLALAAGIVAVLVVIGAVRWWRGRARRRFAAEVRRALARPAPQARLAALAGLLRRAALARRDGREALPLSGDDWLAWLERRTGRGFFAEGPGRVFGEALYRPAADPDWDRLAHDLPAVLAQLAGGRDARPR